MTDERVDPPLVADEKATLAGFLDFHRDTFLWKIDGLSPDQLRIAACPPSDLTLWGLLRHLAEVDRGWFHDFDGADLPPLYCTEEDPDGDLVVPADADFEADLATLPVDLRAQPGDRRRPLARRPAGHARSAPTRCAGSSCTWSRSTPATTATRTCCGRRSTAPPASSRSRSTVHRMGIQGFSHVGVCVSDLDRSTRFYVDVLGFEELFTWTWATRSRPRWRWTGRCGSGRGCWPGTTSASSCCTGSRAQASGDRERRPMDRFGLTHLCIRVDDVEDLVDAAVAAGGTVHRQTHSVLEGAGVGGGPVGLLYLTDPDGTRIELMSGTPDLSGLRGG